MKNLCVSIAVVLCLLLAASPAYAKGKDKKVVVEGLGDNNAKGRQDAYNDALRKAIEKAVGTYVSVEMQIENRQVIEEKIYSRNQAYIKSSKVLHQGLNKDGLWAVKLEAVVEEGQIKDDLQAFKIVQARKGNPRLMVIVKVEERDKHWYTNPDARGVKAKIEKRLQRKKFRLVDVKQLKDIKAIEAAASAGNAAKLKALVQSYGAEVIVSAHVNKSFIEKKNMHGRMVDFWSIDLSLSAVVADTADMIYSDSAQIARTGRFEQAHTTAEKLAKEMIPVIMEKWQSDVFNSANFVLTAEGVTYDDVQLLKEGLAYSLGVGTVTERSYAEKIAVMEVSFAGSADQFGLMLEDMEEPDIKVKARSANKFTVVSAKGAPAPVVKVVTDTKPPVVMISSPRDGYSTARKTAEITIKGTVDDPEVTSITISDATATVKDGAFTIKVKLTAGPNKIVAKAKDKAGNEGKAAVTVNKTPWITFKILDFEEKTFSGQIQPGCKLTANDKPVALDNKGMFKIVLESAFEGELKFEVVDGAGNKTVRTHEL